MAAFNAHLHPKAAPLFAAAKSADPGHSNALLFEGKSLANVNRFAKALTVLRQYWSQHSQSSDALYMLGFVLNREGRSGRSRFLQRIPSCITRWGALIAPRA